MTEFLVYLVFVLGPGYAEHYWQWIVLALLIPGTIAIRSVRRYE